jgi:chemotaxis signal transduction protein
MTRTNGQEADGSLQVLLCARHGQELAVAVDEIEAIERDRSSGLGTFLVTRTAKRIGVDRAGGVVELSRDQLRAVPPCLARPESGLRGVAEVDSSARLVVTAEFLAQEEPLRLAPPATVTRPRPDVTGVSPVREPHLFTFPLFAEPQCGSEVVVGIPFEQILEVTEPLPWIPLSVEGGFLRGVVPWRGRVASLVDLPRCLGLACDGPTPDRRLLIVRGTTRSEPLALFTGTATQRAAPSPTTELHPEDVGLRPGSFRGAFRWENRVLVIPDFDALV